MRHEGLAVVFANVAVRHKASFAAQVARTLPALVVLYDDGVPSIPQENQNRFPMQRHKPADLQLVGRDSLLVKDFAGFLDHSLRRTPANQGYLGIARPPQFGWRNRSLNSHH